MHGPQRFKDGPKQVQSRAVEVVNYFFEFSTTTGKLYTMALSKYSATIFSILTIIYSGASQSQVYKYIPQINHLLLSYEEVTHTDLPPQPKNGDKATVTTTYRAVEDKTIYPPLFLNYDESKQRVIDIPLFQPSDSNFVANPKSSIQNYIYENGWATVGDPKLSSETYNSFVEIHNPYVVPEPEEYMMMLLGFGMVGWQVRRKQKKSASAIA